MKNEARTPHTTNTGAAPADSRWKAFQAHYKDTAYLLKNATGAAGASGVAAGAAYLASQFLVPPLPQLFSWAALAFAGSAVLCGVLTGVTFMHERKEKKAQGELTGNEDNKPAKSLLVRSFEKFNRLSPQKKTMVGASLVIIFAAPLAVAFTLSPAAALNVMVTAALASGLHYIGDKIIERKSKPAEVGNPQIGETTRKAETGTFSMLSLKGYFNQSKSGAEAGPMHKKAREAKLTLKP